jgi:hypothetical protein
MSDEILRQQLNINRRHFLSKLSLGVGSVALGSLLVPDLFKSHSEADALPVGLTNFAPKAKRVIYLFQSGAPSQLDLFDYKPLLTQMRGKDLPESVRNGQRLTGMTSGQKSFPLVNSVFNFSQHGKSGAWLSELLPYTGKVADDICFIKSMNTEAINHDPAITFFQTGNQQPGRPSMGSWLSYGIGSMNQNLPAFCVLLSKGTGRPVDQPIPNRVWNSGFLNSVHQGVVLRSDESPVFYLSDQQGLDRQQRRQMLDKVAALNHIQEQEFGDPEITARIAQYELAYRMQTSVPDTMNISDEPPSTFKLYGDSALKPNTFAANCILARRLAERGVRFIQLYHMGWDQHDNCPDQIKRQAMDVDQASAALITDLKQRGMLDDTLVIWGGEFGRTNYCQGQITDNNYGRDHHPRCFTVWMAGGGIKPGMTYGESDEFGYNVASNPVHVHDFHATILNQLGLDHEKLLYKYEGRRFRLTDVAGQVVHDIIA